MFRHNMQTCMSLALVLVTVIAQGVYVYRPTSTSVKSVRQVTTMNLCYCVMVVTMPIIHTA